MSAIAVRGRLGVVLFQGALDTVGLMLTIASRRRRRLRRQLTRDVLIEVRTEDGARQQFQVDSATRRISVPATLEHRAEVALVFPSGWHGLRVLLSRHTIGRIVEGMNYGETRIEGNPILVLWFHGLTRIVLPIGTTRRPRFGRRGGVPVRVPETELPYAKWLRREPATSELSRDWPEAWAARAKLLQLRAPAGERLPPG